MLITNEKDIKIATLFGVALFLIYIVAMFILPSIYYWGNSTAFIKMLKEWQGINTGVLALLTSIVVLNIAHLKEERQRQREFIAARAFLPSALSELYSYLSESFRFLNSISNVLEYDAESELVQDTGAIVLGPPAIIEAPQLTGDYKQVFKDCITTAEPLDASFLATTLSQFQKLNRDLTIYEKSFSSQSSYEVSEQSLSECFLRLGDVAARINRAFSFANGSGKLDLSELRYDEVRGSLIGFEYVIEESPHSANYKELLKSSDYIR